MLEHARARAAVVLVPVGRSGHQAVRVRLPPPAHARAGGRSTAGSSRWRADWRLRSCHRQAPPARASARRLRLPTPPFPRPARAAARAPLMPSVSTTTPGFEPSMVTPNSCGSPDAAPQLELARRRGCRARAAGAASPPGQGCAAVGSHADRLRTGHAHREVRVGMRQAEEERPVRARRPLLRVRARRSRARRPKPAPCGYRPGRTRRPNAGCEVAGFGGSWCQSPLALDLHAGVPIGIHAQQHEARARRCRNASAADGGRRSSRSRRRNASRRATASRTGACVAAASQLLERRIQVRKRKPGGDAGPDDADAGGALADGALRRSAAGRCALGRFGVQASVARAGHRHHGACSGEQQHSGALDVRRADQEPPPPLLRPARDAAPPGA